jgi:sulfite oxidase
VTAVAKRQDMVVHQREPLNAESPPHALCASMLTPLDAFYVRNHGPAPKLDASAWRLRVSGDVDRELELSLGELQERFAHRELTATLQCAGNRRAALIAVRDIPGEAPWRGGATGTASWRGVALRDVLEVAGLGPKAKHVAFLGADVSEDADPPQPFGGSIPRHKAMGEEVLSAWQMNGRPLTRVHGAPLRVVVPGYIGARSVKWVTEITARAEPSENYFQAHAYRLFTPDLDPDLAPPGSGVALRAVAVNADVLSPADGSTVAAGPVEIIGYAFAGGDRHIVRVDVSEDGGARWRQAELIDPPAPWAWRRWRATVTLPHGRHQIVARAWDSAAATQPERAERVWNPKGYANNAWPRVNVVGV